MAAPVSRGAAAAAPRRVAVTGLGVVAASGIGKDAFWQGALSGRSSLAPITRFDCSVFDCRIAGEAPGFAPEAHVPRKVQNQTDRSTWMAMACCDMAVEDAGLDLGAMDPAEVGMSFANLFGGMEFAEPELYAQSFLGPEKVSAYQAIAWFYAAAQGQWSIRNGIRGWGKSFVGDRAGGLQAVAWGALAIRQGHCRAALAGGFEAPLVPYVFLIHQSSGLLSRRRGSPERAYLPFDLGRSGLALGEGAGILLLEDLEHARSRGARVYAEVAGFASSCDAYHYADPAPDGRELARCLQAALDAAGSRPDEVDHVLADGAATAVGDRSEAAALRRVFGDKPRATLSVPKAAIGHTLAAAGALDAACAALMLREGVVAPSVRLESPDPELPLLHVTGEPRQRRLESVLCCSRGHGGLNSALVLRRLPEC